MVRVIRKPYGRAELTRAVEEVLAGRGDPGCVVSDADAISVSALS